MPVEVVDEVTVARLEAKLDALIERLEPLMAMLEGLASNPMVQGMMG